MAHRIITNEADLIDLGRLLGNLTLPITVEWVQGRDRTGEQNRIMWLWATETALQLGDRTTAETQRDWKLRHGVPILRESSPEFRATYDKHIRPLPYQEKVAFMDMIDVTSAMKVRQMVAFLDAVQRECLEQGLHLTDPSPDLAAYQKRYRQNEAA